MIMFDLADMIHLNFISISRVLSSEYNNCQ